MIKPKTEQGWIDLAEEVVTAAKDAATANDKTQLRTARTRCSDFVNKRTSLCPQEVVDAVAAVQAQLSQLIVSEAVGSISSRTTQINAYLQDIKKISEQAAVAADLVSLTKVKSITTDITTIITEAKSIKESLEADDADTDAALNSIQNIVAKLEAIEASIQSLG